MSWSQLENRVREISSLRYGASAEAMRLKNGVNHDCVCKVSERHWVIVEITKNNTVDKVRGDVNRLVMTRHQLFTQEHIMCECWIILDLEPTASMRDAAEENGIKISSIDGFISEFFDQRQYSNIRQAEKFGSAVDIISGDPDKKPFIPVAYDDTVRSKSYRISDICDYLVQGFNVVLTGTFGSGKSRCCKEVFESLSKRSDVNFLSVDLRDVGALASANQIVRAHFESMGLDGQAEAAIRLLNSGKLILLLDGFDEMGGTQWSDDPQKLRDIRRRTLKPVREIVEKAHSTIITGREHYFNSDDELLDAVGVSNKKFLHLECREEFSTEEISNFLKAFQIEIEMPEWLPKRPLLYQILVELQGDLSEIRLDQASGQAELWSYISTLICRREARINANFEEETIFAILKRLGRESRHFPKDVEPVTLESLKSAYKAVRGYEPAEEDAVLLQKLPGLGRISYDSRDRRFVDKYLVDGFRSSDLADYISFQDEDLSETRWINSLDTLGLSVIGKALSEQMNDKSAIALAKRAADRENSVLAADIVAGLGFSDADEIDGSNIQISGAEILFLDMTLAHYKNITFESCIFHKLQLADYEVKGVEIRNSIITEILGVPNEAGVPPWVSGCEITSFDDAGNVASIKNLKLSAPQRILCVVLHKTFFQPGRGRQEEALLRGLGQVDRHKNTKEILKILQREGLLTVDKGRHGNLYIPNITQKPLASKILSLQSQCNEPIWHEVSSLPS